jgi:divalent metal cation (Fe/Co/Zn/Cd) transporter
LLVGESADAEVVAHIRAVMETDPAVEWMMPPLTMHLGPHDMLLNLEITCREERSTAEIGAAVDRREKNLRRRNPDIKRICIEAESLSGSGRQTYSLPNRAVHRPYLEGRFPCTARP